MSRALLVLAVLAATFQPAAGEAGPRKRAIRPVTAAVAAKAVEAAKTAPKAAPKTAKATVAAAKTRGVDPKAKTRGAARVAFSVAGEMRATGEVTGRKEEQLSIEESTAKQIEKIMRGPLRRGITGMYVADARTGSPIFAVNADDPLNPASNVKMISTATALELLGPTFRYSTRVLGREPDTNGLVKGDMFLLGTWDPTLAMSDMDQLASQIVNKGVKQLDGDILVGTDATRDGIYRAVVPIQITAGDANAAPTATPPTGFDFVDIEMKAKTAKKAMKRHRLTFATTMTTNAAGKKRIRLTIGGTIGLGGSTTYQLATKERTWMASHALRAALRQHGVTVNGDVRSAELGDFVGDAVQAAGLPVELGRHDSDQLQDIVRRVNKWSINWLADRVIMTAAALTRRTTPSMPIALEAMYDWLQRHPQLDKNSVVIDTGSGLSYRTRITPTELVKVVRAASGYAPGTDEASSKAWKDSLSISGTDGTLRSRFRTADLRGHIHGKTGTLSSVIAISGLLDVDPSRPLAFSIVTNTTGPLKKAYIRKVHEQLVQLLAEYVAATAKPTSMPAGTPVKVGTPAATSMPAIDENAPAPPEEIAEPQPDPELDFETAGQPTMPKASSAKDEGADEGAEPPATTTPPAKP